MNKIAGPANNKNLSLEERIIEKIALLRKVEEDIPSIIIVHDLRDTSVTYMSARGLVLLHISLDELRAMGPEYHSRFFNPEFAEHYTPKILELLERDNDDEVISFFQQVRSSEKEDWTWYLSCTKIFMRDDTGKPLLIITNATPIEAQHHITAKAERLLQDNSFLRKHHHLFSLLTKREKEILQMMALGESSARMAKKLHISQTTASTHRRNIKRKLKIRTHYDITRFAQAFDLI